MSGLLIYYTTVSDTYWNPNSVGENSILMLLLHKTLSLKISQIWLYLADKNCGCSFLYVINDVIIIIITILLPIKFYCK